MIRSSSRFLTALGGLIALSLTLTGPAFAQKDGAPAERYGRASSGDIVERTLPEQTSSSRSSPRGSCINPRGPARSKGLCISSAGPRAAHR